MRLTTSYGEGIDHEGLSGPYRRRTTLKAGRYRVYLRLYLKDGGRSDSYSFVTDLP